MAHIQGAWSHVFGRPAHRHRVAARVDDQLAAEEPDGYRE
jgi:hypothetical protein